MKRPNETDASVSHLRFSSAKIRALMQPQTSQRGVDSLHVDPVGGAARRRERRSARPLARLLDLRRAPPGLDRRARSLLAFRGRRSRHPAGATVGRGARRLARHRVDDVVPRRAAERRRGLRPPVGAGDAGPRGGGVGARGGRAPVADVGGALARGAASGRGASRARRPARATPSGRSCRCPPRPRSRRTRVRTSARSRCRSSPASPGPAVSSRLADAGAKVVVTADASYRRGQARADEGGARRGARGRAERRARRRLAARRRRVPDDARTRRLVGRDRRRQGGDARVRSRSRARRRTSSPTRRARPASRRARCTSRAASCSRSRARPRTRRTSAPGTASSSRRTWAGSWVRGPWSARWPAARRSSSWRARPTGPPTGSGSSSEAERVTMLGVSPTLVRALIPHGDPDADLSSLRSVVTTGEPWNRGPYDWLDEHVCGKGRIPIVNCSGGTEVGACFLSVTMLRPTKPCSLGFPGARRGHGRLRRRRPPAARRGRRARLHDVPWPGMTRGIWGDPERYLETYWRRFPGVWTHGDWASVDDDGYWFLHGRSDDTLNIAGKRIGPAELESAAVGSSGGRRGGRDRRAARGEGRGRLALLRARARAPRRRARMSRTRCRTSSARRSRPIASSSSRRCRRRGARRSCAARSARVRSGRIPATCRRSRTPRRWRRSHVPSDRLDGVALVTGGGRGIGASIARELADAGMRVAVTGRTREQVEAVADEIGGLALVGDVSHADDVERWVETAERELGPIDLLVANAGIGQPRERPGRSPVEDWWRVFEVNVLGVHLSCRAVVPSMLERASGRDRDHRQRRRVPSRHPSGTAYAASKAAVCRYGETLAERARGSHPRLLLQPRARAHGR